MCLPQPSSGRRRPALSRNNASVAAARSKWPLSGLRLNDRVKELRQGVDQTDRVWLQGSDGIGSVGIGNAGIGSVTGGEGTGTVRLRPDTWSINCRSALSANVMVDVGFNRTAGATAGTASTETAEP